MGSLSFLQGMFPTQELNQGLLHWRRILNQLSYQGIELNLKDYWAWSLENRKHNQEVMAQWLHLPCIQYHMQTGTQRLLLDWRNGGVWWSIPETVVRLSRYRDYGKWVGGKRLRVKGYLAVRKLMMRGRQEGREWGQEALRDGSERVSAWAGW